MLQPNFTMNDVNKSRFLSARKENDKREAVIIFLLIFSFLSLSAIIWPTMTALAQQQNATNQTGIANQTELENLTGTTFGNKTGNPNATTLEGLEKSQMGNIIPGQQNTTFEGQNMSTTGK